MMNILVIIPARGGSKGIPRKNLRSLGGKPLLSYSIKTALASVYHPDVYVSSDDDDIISCAKKFGAEVHKRPAALSTDEITLDPVIYEAYLSIMNVTGKAYDLIVTLQPTSPMLKTASLDEAITMMVSSGHIDTIISAVNDTHLTWLKNNNEFKPNYQQRVNRQFLPQVFRETGGFLITRNNVISQNSRIGKFISLYELSGAERIDIDHFEDWALCEFYLNRKKIAVIICKDFTKDTELMIFDFLNSVLLHDIQIFIDSGKKDIIDKIKNWNFAWYEVDTNDMSFLNSFFEFDIAVVFSKDTFNLPGLKLKKQFESDVSIYLSSHLNDLSNIEFLDLGIFR